MHFLKFQINEVTGLSSTTNDDASDDYNGEEIERKNLQEFQ